MIILIIVMLLVLVSSRKEKDLESIESLLYIKESESTPSEVDRKPEPNLMDILDDEQVTDDESIARDALSLLEEINE